MWWILIVACAPSGSEHRSRAGNPLTDDGEAELIPDTAGADTADTAFLDTGDTAAVDTGPVDTGVPSEVCYLGPDRRDSTCVPVVADDGSFGSAYDYPAPYSGSPQYNAPARYLDLDSLDPDLELAPNFVLEEVAAAYKGRWGVVQSHLVDRLQDIRDDIGGPLTITSGYRSPEYNAGVGGVEYSRHQYGDGVDLDASGFSVEELGDVCYDHGADYVGLYEDGHTHCDWRNEALDPAFFDRSGARPAPPPPVSAVLTCANGWCTAPALGFDEGEPLRRWTAFGKHGEPLATALGRQFQVPAGAERVTVRVGGAVELSAHPE